MCGQPMASGEHTQFRGQRFCPYQGNETKQEWLAKKRQEAKEKSEKAYMFQF